MYKLFISLVEKYFVVLIFADTACKKIFDDKIFVIYSIVNGKLMHNYPF